MKRWVIPLAVLGIVVAVGIIILLNWNGSTANSPLRHVVVAIDHPPTTTDPVRIVEVNSLGVALAMHAPLAVVDRTGKLRLVAAKRMKMTDDAKSCEIELRDDIKFWDESPVTSADLVASVKRLRGSSHPHRWILSSIKGIEEFDKKVSNEISGLEVTGERTLRIRFISPDPDFLQFISSSAMLITKRGTEKNKSQTYDTHVIGCGPFTPDEIDPGNRIKLKRNPGYPLPSRLESLEFKVMESPQSQLQGLGSGQIHVVRLRGPILAEALNRAADGTVIPATKFGNCQVEMSPANELVFISLNWKREPLSKIPVEERQNWQQRLSSAFDRQGLADSSYLGRAEPASTIVPPTLLEFAAKNETPSGKKTGFTLELLCASDSDSRRLGQYVQTRAKEIGVQFELVYLDLNQLIGRVIGGKFQSTLLWIENQIPSGVIPWTNFFRADNPVVALAEAVDGVKPMQAKARQTLDKGERQKAYREIVKHINSKQTSWIPLISRNTVYLVDGRLDGVFLDVNGVAYWHFLSAKN